MSEKHPDDYLDSALKAVHDDTPSAEDALSAANRVRAALYIAADDEDATPASYEDLIPDYLAGRLSTAQVLLFEEESRRSVPLRRALETTRQSDHAPKREVAPKDRANLGRWAIAAAIAAIAIISVKFLLPILPAGDQSQLARIESIDGTLHQLTDIGLVEVAAGTWLNGDDTVRTAKGSSAILTLDDGSRIELDERSQLSVVRLMSGNRVSVDRGRIIVQAAEQGFGTLDVATDELLVSVKGTIFGVSHGSNGSHVAVIEGAVDVYYDGTTLSLEPGDQVGTRTTLLALELSDEVAWSQNADTYIAMLQELKQVQDEIEALMTTEPRFSTRLLDLAPEQTLVYVAVPNASATVAEAYDLLKQHMLDSERLGEAWQQFEQSGDNAEVEEVMTWLRDIGEYLGNETAVALRLEAQVVLEEQSIDVAPIVLSEVKTEGLKATLAAKLAELEAQHADSDEMQLRLIDDPADAQEHTLSIWITGDLMVASTSPSALTEIEAVLAGAANPFVGSDFHVRLNNAYGDGVEFLGGMDLSLLTQRLLQEGEHHIEVLGFDNAEHVIVERRQRGEHATTSAALYFAGERRGLASWLDTPGPMAALEFFSPNTDFVAAAMVTDPAFIMDDVLSIANELSQEPINVSAMYADTQIDIRNELLIALGGEIAVGLDGPALPQPSWKVVVEVYDTILLQQTIEDLIEVANERGIDPEHELRIELAITTQDSQTYYQVNALVRDVGSTEFDVLASVHYAFVDGYLIMTPSRVLIEQAMNYADSGSTILSASQFQELLPTDSYLDFSAVTYSRLSEMFSEILAQLPKTTALTDDQLQALEDLSSGGPTVACAYGEPDHLRFVMNGPTAFPFMGLAPLIGASLVPIAEAEVQ